MATLPALLGGYGDWEVIHSGDGELDSHEDSDVAIGETIGYVIEGLNALDSEHSNEVEIVLTGRRPDAPIVSVSNIGRFSADISAGAANSPEGLAIVETEVRVIRQEDGEVAFGPVFLGAGREFPVLAEWLTPGDDLIAQVRDYDVYGPGEWGEFYFSAAENTAPTAPVVITPVDGSSIDLNQPVVLDATESTDADGDELVYFWRYRRDGVLDWTLIPTGPLGHPRFVWEGVFDEIGIFQFAPGVSDGFVEVWGDPVTVNAGFDTTTVFEDFSDFPIGTLDWEKVSLADFNPGGPIDAQVLPLHGAYGRRAVEYNCGGGANIYQTQVWGHIWKDGGVFFEPVVEARFWVRHTYTQSGQNTGRHFGLLLNMGGEPLAARQAKGYAIFVSPSGTAGGFAYENLPTSAPKGLQQLSSSLPFLEHDTPYILRASILGTEVVTLSTLRKAYLDWRNGDGPFAGANPFGSIDVPAMLLKVEILDDRTREVLGEAILRHIPTVAHDEDVVIDQLSFSGEVGFCVSDWSGSVVFDWIAVRSTDIPVIPTLRAETSERWFRPWFGENPSTSLSLRWRAVQDPRGRPVLTRIERRNREISDSWETIAEGFFVVDGDGFCEHGPVSTLSWRQSRGWQLAISHSFDAGETWSERILTQRFIIDRSGGTFTTGFSEYSKAEPMPDWSGRGVGPQNFRPFDTPPMVSRDGAVIRHEFGGSIFTQYSHRFFAWHTAGIRGDSAVWATQRVTSLQGRVGLGLKVPLEGSTGAFFAVAEIGGYTDDRISVGRIGGSRGASQDIPLATLGADYHMIFQSQRQASGREHMIFRLWRDQVESEEDAIEVDALPPGSGNPTGLVAIVSGAAAIHGYRSGPRVRETDNFTATFLEPLPDDREFIEELVESEDYYGPVVKLVPNPDFVPNEPPDIEEAPPPEESPDRPDDFIVDEECTSPWDIQEPRQDDDLWQLHTVVDNDDET